MLPTSKQLIEHIGSRGGIRTRKLAATLGVGDAEFDDLVAKLMDLQKEGSLVRVPATGWHLPAKTAHRVGTLRLARGGYGFVIPVRTESAGDIYVPTGAVGSAFDGDLVLVELTSRRRSRGRGGATAAPSRAVKKRDGPAGQGLRVGRVVDIVERRLALVRGRYRSDDRSPGRDRSSGFGTALKHPRGRDIFVAPDMSGGATDGDKVLVCLLDGHDHGVFPRGEVVHVVADDGSLESDFETIAAEFGFPVDHSPAAVREASRLAVEPCEEDLVGREDLRELLVFTIDPDDARDFDDAISLQRLPGGKVRLGVHIADVAHHVRPGSALDDDARARGTSIYLPGRVVPMLPERISNGLASLRPDEDHLTKTVSLDFDSNGEILDARVFPSVIRSRRRFTYGEALAILEVVGGAGEASSESTLPDDHEAYAVVLGDMAKLRDCLHRRRMERGSLSLELARPSLDIDPATGDVLGISRESTDPSHQLIEEFMLAANEVVARYMNDLGLPWLARAHDEPDAERLGEFFQLLEAIESRHSRSGKGSARRRASRSGGAAAGQSLQRTLDEIRHEPWAPIVSMALLRSLPHAEYRFEAAGHFALAATFYCHFTSPIRRYPDLVVHQILDEHWSGRLREPPRQLEWTEKLGAFAAASSAAERRAEEAERAMTRLRLIRHLEGLVGEKMAGVITGVHSFGFFVQEQSRLLDGLVHVSTLGDDYYEFVAEEYCLRGARGRVTFHLGDHVRVELAELDVDSREVRFRFVGESGKEVGTGDARRSRKKRR